MQKLLFTFLILGGLSYGNIHSSQESQYHERIENNLKSNLPQSNTQSRHQHNILTKEDNIIIVTNYELIENPSFWGLPTLTYLLEAYDIETGDLVWRIDILKPILSIISDENKIIYRTESTLNAVNVKNGNFLWSKPVKGNYHY